MDCVLDSAEESVDEHQFRVCVRSLSFSGSSSFHFVCAVPSAVVVSYLHLVFPSKCCSVGDPPLNQADICIAGGTETMSDVPIRLSKRLRRRLLDSQKVRYSDVKDKAAATSRKKNKRNKDTKRWWCSCLSSFVSLSLLFFSTGFPSIFSSVGPPISRAF